MMLKKKNGLNLNAAASALSGLKKDKLAYPDLEEVY